jgi:hypothetical protein
LTGPPARSSPASSGPLHRIGVAPSGLARALIGLVLIQLAGALLGDYVDLLLTVLIAICARLTGVILTNRVYRRR